MSWAIFTYFCAGYQLVDTAYGTACAISAYVKPAGPKRFDVIVSAQIKLLQAMFWKHWLVRLLTSYRECMHEHGHGAMTITFVSHLTRFTSQGKE
jgi:hypothetical protein